MHLYTYKHICTHKTYLNLIWTDNIYMYVYMYTHTVYMYIQCIYIHTVTVYSLLLIYIHVAYIYLHICVSDQIRSVAQSCPTLCDPMNRSMPGLPVHHQLPEYTQTHVH